MKSLTTEGTLKAYCNRHLPVSFLGLVLFPPMMFKAEVFVQLISFFCSHRQDN